MILKIQWNEEKNADMYNYINFREMFSYEVGWMGFTNILYCTDIFSIHYNCFLKRDISEVLGL